MWYQCNTVVKEFLSTLSLRRATNTSTTEAQDGYISIHALLAESDCSRASFARRQSHFYPRSPCGERPARKRQV